MCMGVGVFVCACVSVGVCVWACVCIIIFIIFAFCFAYVVVNFIVNLCCPHVPTMAYWIEINTYTYLLAATCEE